MISQGAAWLCGLQVFAGEGELGGGLLKRINANYSLHCYYFLLLVEAGKHSRLNPEAFWRYLRMPVAVATQPSLLAVRVSQALNLRNFWSIQASAWLCSGK